MFDTATLFVTCILTILALAGGYFYLRRVPTAAAVAPVVPTSPPMAARDPALFPYAAVAVAYDPSVLPVSDRMMDLAETPLGAMALLAGLVRQREGGPLNALVRLGLPFQFDLILH